MSNCYLDTATFLLTLKKCVPLQVNKTSHSTFEHSKIKNYVFGLYPLYIKKSQRNVALILS